MTETTKLKEFLGTHKQWCRKYWIEDGTCECKRDLAYAELSALEADNAKLRADLDGAIRVIDKLYDDKCLDVDGYCIYNEYKERVKKGA
jgi:hypothetical protein